MTHILCYASRRHWKVWWVPCISPQWISKADSGRSQQYSAFTMGNLGFYKFTHMPFGLCNAPMTFQCLMQNTLRELNLTYCVIYLDDVIVFRRSEEEHLECLHIMFECFREYNLKLKPSKCLFFQSEIVYLAHHVSHEGICPSRENVCAIEEFLMLETFTQVCTFCGLVGHYWCFIKGFANIVRLLYDVLGKEVMMDPEQLPLEAWKVLRILKDKILSTPMLVFLDFDKLFLMEMDASKEGLGAMLSQKQDDRHYHPITFGSRSLTPAGRNYHSSKLEFLTLKVECYRAFQGVPSIHAICGQDGQQSIDICPYNPQLRCHRAQMGWHIGLL